MRNRFLTFLSVVAIFILCTTDLFAADQSRGLWACNNIKGNGVFVSWRMRATDAPKSTTYKLYANGNLVSTLTDRTNVTLDKSYANATFSLEVLDASGNVIDSQEGVKCKGNFFHHIKLTRPANYRMPDGTEVDYHPNDGSAYDMDGDGEQELIFVWAPSNIGANATPTAPGILECYKLNGTRLWSIDFGPNVLVGCRFSFLCYDFDGDGKGEVIARTAQGCKDGSGNFLQKGAAQGANHYASSVTNGVITNGGKEWITCFDGVSGKELATIDYWPTFNIRSNWDDRSGRTDGADYGHRGNWLKSCVAFLDVNGKPTPCAVTNRGIYTYSYASAIHWDGNKLNVLWKHTSDVAGQGIYGEGAHSITCGDVDNDGFDEIIVGTAALDHDGKLLWRTGLKHGDATHLGEFDPSNEGMEYFTVMEETTVAYDAVMLDARTGRVITSKAQTGGDTGRGLILDCDDKHDGAEIIEISDANLMDCKGNPIAPWHVGTTTSSSINYRVYWDGDLLEEYHDRQHVDKWDSNGLSWGRLITIWQHGYGANTNNGTKYNPTLLCDLIGDWREEIVYWGVDDNSNYYLTIFHSTDESQYKLPWLRDDHTYDMAIAWQHCGYNQPPHLGYSPVEYYKKLSQALPAATLTKHGSGPSKQTVKQGEAIEEFSYTWENAETVTVSGLPNGVSANINIAEKCVHFSGTANDEPGEYKFTVTTVGNDENVSKSGSFTIEPAEEPTHAANKASELFCISPNPMSQRTTVRFAGKTNFSWSLHDMNGSVMQKGSGDSDSFVLKRKNLSAGMYLLIISAEGKSFEERLIVK